MKTKMNNNETKKLINLIFKIENNINSNSLNALIESDNIILIEDYLFNEYGIEINNGYSLMEADGVKQGVLSKVFGFISNIIKSIGEFAKSILQSIWYLIKKFLKFTFTIGVFAGAGYVLKLTGALGDAKGAMGSAKSYLQSENLNIETGKKVLTNIYNFIMDVVNFIVDNIVNLINEHKDKLQNENGGVSSYVNGFIQKLLSVGRSIKSFTFKFFEKSGVIDLYTYLQEKFIEVLDRLASLGTSDEIAVKIDEYKSKTGAFINTVASKASTILTARYLSSRLSEIEDAVLDEDTKGKIKQMQENPSAFNRSDIDRIIAKYVHNEE